MRALLDTHTFLWAITQESRLSQRARSVMESCESWFSVASIWEILIKTQVGKLSLPSPAGPYVTSRLAANGVQVLAVALDHVLRIESLDLHHRDPFDRMLVAQCLEEKLVLVTADPVFQRYPIDLIW